MRILMIEDDRQLSDATALQLRHDGYEVDTCYDGDEGLYYFLEGQYDLVLLDRMLPGIEGMSLLKQARAKGKTTPVLMLTALGLVGDRVDGLESGADDYLVKPFDYRELNARIRALIRRPAIIENRDEARFGDLLLDLSALTLEGEKARCTLSKKEAEFLGMLMKNNGATVARGKLFGRVWGPDTDAEESGIDSYAHFIRRRLKHVSNRVQLTTVRGIGYRLEDSND